MIIFAKLQYPGYQYLPGQYPAVEQPQWGFPAAIQGIVPEPERFGDLCEKGLVPIISTPTHEVVNNPAPHPPLPLIKVPIISSSQL